LVTKQGPVKGMFVKIVLSNLAKGVIAARLADSCPFRERPTAPALSRTRIQFVDGA
jgi:hypothetical protein